jgi:hypothetical protein
MQNFDSSCCSTMAVGSSGGMPVCRRKRFCVLSYLGSRGVQQLLLQHPQGMPWL